MSYIVVAVLIVLFSSIDAMAQSNMQLKRRWIAEDKLEYITDRQFPMRVRDGALVEITDTVYHTIDQRVDRDGRYIRRAVLFAIAPLEQAFQAKFGKRLPITGAFRTVEHHEELRTRNNNAAQGNSPHTTGYTVDISYLWMTRVEQRFVENWLRAKHRRTLVYTKERFQKCYDVFFRPPQLQPTPRHRRARS